MMQVDGMTSRKRARRAFTLIELLVVVTIIGILAALVVPRIVGRIGGAKQAVARTNLKALEVAVLGFQVDCGRFPTTQEGVWALVRPPSDVSEKWQGPYAKEKEILDPWDEEYHYRYPGLENPDFDLFSLGADKQEGGEGEDADIGNW